MKWRVLTQELDPNLRLRGRPDCDSRLECDLAAFTLPEFRAGLLAAVVVLGFGLLVVAIARRSATEPLPIIGLLLLLGAAGAYGAVDRLLPWVVLSLATLSLAGHVADRAQARLPGRVGAAVPGATMLAATPALDGLVPMWSRVLLAAVTAVGSALACEVDRVHARLAVAPVCLAVSVVAVYETVPDTDLVLALLPLVLILALLAWPEPMARLGAGGTYGAIGLLLFTVLVGGRGRLSAVVGGVACLGLLALEPAARRFARGASVLDVLPRSAASTVLVGLTQLIFVVAATRVAGTRPTVLGAVLIALPATVIGLIALAVAGRRCTARQVVAV